MIRKFLSTAAVLMGSLQAQPSSLTAFLERNLPAQLNLILVLDHIIEPTQFEANPNEVLLTNLTTEPGLVLTFAMLTQSAYPQQRIQSSLRLAKSIIKALEDPDIKREWLTEWYPPAIVRLCFAFINEQHMGELRALIIQELGEENLKLLEQISQREEQSSEILNRIFPSLHMFDWAQDIHFNELTFPTKGLDDAVAVKLFVEHVSSLPPMPENPWYLDKHMAQASCVYWMLLQHECGRVTLSPAEQEILCRYLSKQNRQGLKRMIVYSAVSFLTNGNNYNTHFYPRAWADKIEWSEAGILALLEKKLAHFIPEWKP